MTNLARRDLGHALIDAYVAWREASAAARDAYEGWTWALSGDGLLAFAAYRAALDREERAAEVYAGIVTQVAGTTPRAIERHMGDLSGAAVSNSGR